MHPIYRLALPVRGGGTPTHWSYSALTGVEACPRRWWLEYGQYAEFNRYPQPPFAATVTGRVVHGALDEFFKALQAAGNPAVGTPAFTAVREGFPLRERIKVLRRIELVALESNPRADVVAIGHEVKMQDCVEAFKRLRLQTFVEEPTLQDETPPQSTLNGRTAPSGQRATTLDERVYAEHDVEIEDPPFRGTVDLVLTSSDGDVVVDFKTGEPKPEHELQTRLYAWLWWRETGRPVRERRVVYKDHPVANYEGLDAAQLDSEADALRGRLHAAAATLKVPLPVAKPDVEICKFCPVRQLCDEYWLSPRTRTLRLTDEVLATVWNGEAEKPVWGDFELTLCFCTGSAERIHSTWTAPDGQQVPLVCPIPSAFHPSQWQDFSIVRIVSCGIRRDADTLRVLTSSRTEFFWKA